MYHLYNFNFVAAPFYLIYLISFFFFTILFLLCSPIINKNLLEARLFFFFYAVEKDCSNMNHFTTILFQVIN